MPILAATNIRYAIGTRVLLDNVSFSMEAGERVGLVGRNGQGKSTLMNVLMSRLKPDSGSVSLQKGVRVGYLTQQHTLDPAKTLREEAAAGFVELTKVHAELDEVYHLMGEPENAEPVALERLLKRQAELESRIEALGGYAVDHKVDAILHGLGFTDAQFSVPVSGLSGGQKGRLGLAKLLLENPDLLLLDEPTNHLDIAGREWLEEFLSTDFKGAVLLVSHDRRLLDRVVTRIEEVEAGRLYEYPGNYTAFREIRAQRLLTQHRAYENQQSQWAKEEEFIRRFKAGQRAKEAQGRLSKLERAKRDDAIERPMEMSTMRISIPPAPRTGDMVVSVRNASKSYANKPHGPQAGDEEDNTGQPAAGRKTLFKDLDLTISRGERWAIIGPNGAGKTTLIRAILGNLDGGEGGLDSGTVRMGSNVLIGYYSQLPPNPEDTSPVYEYLQREIRRENPGASMSEQQARDLAGAFLFSGSDQQKPMSALSGGERSRARLAALLASAKNLLVLDEPTNHLDIPSAERLEQVLAAPQEGDDPRQSYQGTLILISHDRALIDATCKHLLIMDGHGNTEVFHGTYDDWHRKHLAAARSSPSSSSSSSTASTAVAVAAPPPAPSPKKEPAASAVSIPKKVSSSGFSHTPSKPSSGGGSKAKTGFSWMPTDRLEKEIEAVQKRLADMDQYLAKEEVYRDADTCKRALAERDEIAAELERMEEEWLGRMG